ncbi:MAG: hypothetical protein ACE5NA_04415 [Nitrospiraceae bacterium]
MFYFRINKIKIKDNREAPKFLLFGPDLAEVKLFSFVTTGNVSLPSLDELLSTENEDRKREIIKSAVQQVASSRLFTEIKNIKDNSVMTFGDTGYVLYQSETIPDDLNWSFIAIESDKNVRTLGARMDTVVSHKGFDNFAKNLLKVLAGATIPSYTAAVEIGKFVVSVTAETLKENDDDLIGILYMSLNRREHYLRGERKKDDVWDLTNNMQVDYSIFAFES